MSETEKEEEETQFERSAAERLRQAAKRAEKRAEEAADDQLWNEALDWYELAGYLKAAAHLAEDL